MIRKRALLAGMLLLAGASLIAWRRSNSARILLPPQESANASNDLARLASELVDLRREVGFDRLTRAKEVSERKEHGASGEAPTAKEPSSSASRKAPTEREIIAFLDGKFAVQAFDSAWSDNARATATRVLASHLPAGSSLSRVECRSNLCRVETIHETLDQYRAFFQSSFLAHDSGLWNGGFSSWVVEPDAPHVVAVSFIAKEGESVPVDTAIN